MSTILYFYQPTIPEVRHRKPKGWPQSPNFPRKGAFDDICKKMQKAMLLNNHQLLYAYITKLLGDLESSLSFKWLTWNILNKAFIKFKAKLESEKKKINNETQTSSSTIMGMSIKVKASTGRWGNFKVIPLTPRI